MVVWGGFTNIKAEERREMKGKGESKDISNWMQSSRE